ncbi:Protein ZTF-9 [Aphelenchoides avenae]|nr:Protein ZTF-9 [Aphelenchus avenae]
MLVCCCCEASLPTRNELELHLASEHVHYAAYECEHCKTARFPTEYALRQHFVLDHRQKTFYVKLRVTPELEQKRERLLQLLNTSLERSSTMRNNQPASLFTALSNSSDPILSDSTNNDSFALGTYELEDESVPSRARTFKTDEPLVFDTLHQSSSASGIPRQDSSVSQAENEDPKSSTWEATSEMLKALLSGKENADASSTIDKSPVKPRKRARKENSSAEEKQLTCAECGRKVANFSNCMMLHVSTHHCEDAIWECTACDKKWYSMSARTRDHADREHDGDMSVIKDNREEVKPKLKEKVAQLFKVE